MKANVIFVRKHNLVAKQAWQIEMEGIRHWAKIESQKVFDYGVKNYKEGTPIEIDYEKKEDGYIYISFAKQIDMPKVEAPGTKQEAAQTKEILVPKKEERKVMSSTYDYNEGQRRGCVLNNVVAGMRIFEGQFDINDLTLYKKVARELFVEFYDLSGANIEDLKKEINKGLQEVK